jgi:predicted DNA-binding protein
MFTCMSKKTIGARLPQNLVDRLETIARVDRRSVSQVVEILIERGLNTLEEDNASAGWLSEPQKPYGSQKVKK